MRGLRYAPSTRAVVIEGSSDSGTNWTQLGTITVPKDYAEVALSTSTAVDSVRVRLEGDNEPKIEALRELSLFE